MSPPSSGQKNKPSKKLRRWSLYVPPKSRLTFNRLHGVISQKIELCLSTAVRISNPTWYFSSCVIIEIVNKVDFLVM
jgi:hypothetical protein